MMWIHGASGYVPVNNVKNFFSINCRFFGHLSDSHLLKKKSVYKSYFFSYRTDVRYGFIYILYNIVNLLEFHSRHVLCNDTLNVYHISDCAVFLSSMTETHFLISNPMAASIGGRTALPIYTTTSTLLQVTFRKS